MSATRGFGVPDEELAGWDIEAWEARGELPPEAFEHFRQLARATREGELEPWIDRLAERRSLGALLALLSAASCARLTHLLGWDDAALTLPAPWAEPQLVASADLRCSGVLPAVVAARAARSVLVRLDAERMARVRLDAPGVSLVPASDMGLRAAGLQRVVLSDVALERRDIAEIDSACIAGLLLQQRLLAARGLIGWTRELVATTFAFIGQRPFSRSVLASLQVVRHRAADLDAQYQVLLAQQRAAEATDGSRELRVLLLAEHLHGALLELVKCCQQLHGGRGFLSDSWVSRAYRDVRGIGRLLGSRQALRAELARELDRVPLGPDRTRGVRVAASGELVAFRERVRSVIAEHVAEPAQRWEEEPGHFAALHRLFARERLSTVALPTAVGGLGRDFSYNVALIEQLMTDATASTAVSLLIAAGTVFPLIAQHATPAARAELLPRIVLGEAVFAFGITEPGGGSDLVQSLCTRARLEGDEFVLDGEKMFLTNGPIADHVLVLARTGSAAGPLQASLILVPTALPGVVASAPYDKLGLRGSPTGSIALRSVRVPRHNLVGRAGLGIQLLADAAVYERVLIAAGALALATASVERVLGAREGQPWDHARLDALSGQLARLAGQRALVDEVVAKIGRGELDRNDAALLKFSACEAAQNAIESAADASEHESRRPNVHVQRALRDCRIFSVFAGASEMMRDAYSASLLPRIRLGAWGANV